MENMTEALKMAAGVLIFVIALTITINAFGDARRTSEILIKYNDREYLTKYLEEDLDVDGKLRLDRTVGIETIVPTIARAFTENFRVAFKFKDPNTYLYKGYTKNKENNYVTEEYTYIDFAEMNNIGKGESKEIMELLLYGEKVNNFATLKDKYETKKIFLQEKGIYGIIEESGAKKKFKEQIGIFYETELENLDKHSEEEVKNNIPESEKIIKKVITYVEI